jgi:hypothetical protein
MMVNHYLIYVKSFYNGIENILLLLFKHYNSALPNGNKWHMELLEQAFIPKAEQKLILRIELPE